MADSRLDRQLVRAGPEGVRLLSFESDGTVLEIQISGAAGTRSILGQLVRPAGHRDGRAFLQQPTGAPVSAAIDAYGRFEFSEAPEALFRIRVEATGAPSITTAWVMP